MLAPIHALDAGRDPENVKYGTKNGWGGAPFPCTPRDGVPGLGTLQGGGTGLTESFCLPASALLSC